jgi:hypothetical protein
MRAAAGIKVRLKRMTIQGNGITIIKLTSLMVICTGEEHSVNRRIEFDFNIEKSQENK